MYDINNEKLRLYAIEGNNKFFEEFEGNNHLDAIYAQNNLNINQNYTISTLYFLFSEFTKWIDSLSLKTSYSSLPSSYSHFNININDNLIYFLDYGSLLGSYRNNSIISWDVNGDIGFMIRDLKQLPFLYETNEWIFRQNPNITNEMNIYDNHNTIAARFISKLNGIFLNIMAYSLILKDIDKDKDRVAYVYSTLDFIDHNKWHRATDLFPLNKNGGILGNLTNLNVPNNAKKWLLTYYDDLDIPWEYQQNDYDYDYDNYNYYNQYEKEKDTEIKQLKQQLAEQREEIEKLKQHIMKKTNIT